MADEKKPDDILAKARESFERCQEVEADNRKEALEDLKFARLAEQWPNEVRRRRETEGRPCLTINRLPAFIRQVVNDARQNKPAITVHPADSNADPETAKVINGLIRNIEYSSDADVAYDTALEYGVTCGFGYFRINTAYACDDTFEQDIRIERIANPFTVYGDPHSTAADSSDWNVAWVVEEMPKAEFERRYPEAEKVDWTHDFTGLGAPWISEDTVMVAEWWTREKVPGEIVALSNGEIVKPEQLDEVLKTNPDLQIVARRPVETYKVTQRILTGAEVLSEVDWPGRFIPIVPVYGEELNVEGKRILRSLVRDAKDPQRMFNYWRTAATELVALAPKAPFIGPEGFADADPEKWASANTDTHAFIEYKGQIPPQRQPFSGVPAGALQEALNASDDMKSIMGLHDASLGAKSNETSGRAIMARQREGDVSTFHFIDNLSRAIRHAGRILIDLIPKVYSTARMVRVLGPEEQPENVPVNQPVQQQDEQGQITERVYDLTAGKYDLVVRAGPSFTTRREEAANQMMELMRTFPPAAPVIGDLLAKNLDWPGADEIAERLKKLAPGNQPDQPQADPAQMVDLQLKQQQAASDAQLKQQELQIKAFEAETERMRVQLDASKPDRLPVGYVG